MTLFKTVDDPWETIPISCVWIATERQLSRTQPTIHSALDISWAHVRNNTKWNFIMLLTGLCSQRIVTLTKKNEDRCGYDNFVPSLFTSSHFYSDTNWFFARCWDYTELVVGWLQHEKLARTSHLRLLLLLLLLLVCWACPDCLCTKPRITIFSNCSSNSSSNNSVVVFYVFYFFILRQDILRLKWMMFMENNKTAELHGHSSGRFFQCFRATQRPPSCTLFEQLGLNDVNFPK